MPLPIVAIVGRPNVGKSAILNWLARQRISIVDAVAGVTRDRVNVACEYDGAWFELVDTGGFGIAEQDELGEHVEQQIMYAVREAALVLFVVDIKAGVVPLDRRVADLLREFDRPVIVVANKADGMEHESGVSEFFGLGFGEPVPVSAIHSRNREELIAALVAKLGPCDALPEEPLMKLAIVGKRNVGKSTLINALAGDERVIVSEVAGTTRDSVDVTFERDGKAFVAIDTAGVRKKSRIADDVEFYSMVRTTHSIARADVVLLLIDAAVPISDVDKKLAATIEEQFKPCVLVVNKWDLARGQATYDDYVEYLRKMLPGLSYAPVALTTAVTGERVDHAIEVAESLFAQANTRVTTGELNRAVETALAQRPPSVKRGMKRPKVFYATQVGTTPPTIVLFVNSPSLVDDQYRRFLIRRLREQLPFTDIPIRLMFRPRRPSRSEQSR